MLFIYPSGLFSHIRSGQLLCAFSSAGVGEITHGDVMLPRFVNDFVEVGVGQSVGLNPNYISSTNQIRIGQHGPVNETNVGKSGLDFTRPGIVTAKDYDSLICGVGEGNIRFRFGLVKHILLLVKHQIPEVSQLLSVRFGGDLSCLQLFLQLLCLTTGIISGCPQLAIFLLQLSNLLLQFLWGGNLLDSV